MVDPGGIANWSVTHVDWSEGKWHPRSYRAADVTPQLFKNITVINAFVLLNGKNTFPLALNSLYFILICLLYFVQSVNENFHITSDDKVSISVRPYLSSTT